MSTPELFEAQYGRVFEAAGCRTQAELAAFLGIRQSSISDAKRRKSIPAEWLEHFNIEIIHIDKMLWPCGASLRKAREIGAGGLCPPLSDNLKAKML